jgi:hypothetical protein
VTSAVAPAQADGLEYLSEEPQAAAVSRLAVGQALPVISESVLRLTLSLHAGLVEAFLASMIALFDPSLPSRLPSPGTGTRRRPRQAKGKADYRDALQSSNDSTI